MSEPIRIGFIGAGHNTQRRHLPEFRKIPNVELTSVANRSRASAETVAGAFGIARVADSWEEVVQDPSIQAICIGTWPYLHAGVTVAALEAGKHVLCEARMASNLTEARAMLAAAQHHPQCVAQLVPAPYSLDFDATICEIVHSGRLGRLLEVRVTSTSGEGAREEVPLTWRQDQKFSGNNILTLGIVHEIVQRWIDEPVEWILADAAISHAQRRVLAVEGTEESWEKVEIPDTLSVLGRFESSKNSPVSQQEAESLMPHSLEDTEDAAEEDDESEDAENPDETEEAEEAESAESQPHSQNHSVRKKKRKPQKPQHQVVSFPGARLIYEFSRVSSGKPCLEFRLQGSLGALRFDALTQELWFAHAGEVQEELIAIHAEDTRGWQVEADFIESIRTGKPVQLTGFEAGVQYMQFTEMVHESWKKNSTKMWRSYFGA